MAGMRGKAPTDATLATSSGYRTRFSPPIPTESHGRILPETGAPGSRKSTILETMDGRGVKDNGTS